MFTTAPETVLRIGTFSITNSLITSWIVTLIIVVFAVYAHKGYKYIPGKVQNIVEIILESIYNIAIDVAGEKKAPVFFPWVATFFIFIVIANWFSLLPIINAITIHNIDGQVIPLLRSTNADLNAPLALALISLITTQFFGIRYLGIVDYLKRFFGLNPMHQFIGLTELISELAKVVSFSFRLFGNIFAGETLLTLSSSVSTFIIPIPIIGFEMFVGFIQAVVFMMLTLAFMSLISTKNLD